MKCTVVSLSQLGTCWRPTRFLDDCKECPNLAPEKGRQACTTPEARKARVKYWQEQIKAAKRTHEAEMYLLKEKLENAKCGLGESEAKLGGEETA